MGDHRGLERPARPAGLRGPLGAAVAGVFALALLAPQCAAAATDLPTPRFVSLRADKVNVRTGPGVRYPIVWVFQRRGQPVEVTAEYDLWRRIRDVDGAFGWVHTSLLSGERSVVVAGLSTLYRRPDGGSVPVARAEPGVLGRVLACSGAWCRLALGSLRGWTRRTNLWGIYPGEEFD